MKKTAASRSSAWIPVIIILITAALLIGYNLLYNAVEDQFELSYILLTDGSGYSVTGSNKSTENLVIPETEKGLPVRNLSAECFSDTAIRTLKLTSVEQIGKLAFRNCMNLEKVELGQVTHIGDNAFEFCRKLQTITIPESVTHIGSNAFAFCDKLEAVYFLGDPAELGKNAFAYCPDVVIYGVADGNVAHYCAENGLTFQPRT